MKKIIVSVTNNLVNDQRVERVCESLHRWGFEILLVGRAWPVETDIKRPYACKRFRLLFNRNFLFYAEYNLRLFFFLLFRRADILLANDLDTLPANWLAARIKGSRLFFDSHEYFPETPEVYQRFLVKKFWLSVERLCIGNCNVYYTVSKSIADIYYSKYKIQFHVVRNLPFRYRLPSVAADVPPAILYQGTLNKGRGLEGMIRVMPFIPDAKLIIAGDGPCRKNLMDLTASLNLQDRVQFTGMIDPKRLREITFSGSVGISIEEPLGLSYISALPNKLFDYIQARIPVLVSGFPEMRSVVEQYQIGMILEERTPEKLVSVLNIMLYDQVKRIAWKKNLTRAAEELCWDKESEKLKRIIDFELFK